MSKNFKLNLPTLEFYGKKYKLGLGGIHSSDKGQQSIYESNEDYILLDADVTSFYPMSLLIYEICPEHLDKEIFAKIILDSLNDRKEYKKKKKENIIYAALEYGLKISLNSIFGLFAYANFLLLDLLSTYQTTVNNQLFILQLIEELNINGIEVISANTDGVLLYFLRKRYEEVIDICKNWETNTGFSLEYAEYNLYIRADVNNYMARKTDGTIKIKGKFIPSGARLFPYYKYDAPQDGNGFFLPIKGILKGYKIPPVIAIALHKYYLDGISPEDFIPSHNDIFDFCSSQKVGNQFTNILEYVSRTLITNRPDKLKKVLKQEKIKVPAQYEEVFTEKVLKSGVSKITAKRKKIANAKVIPAVYEYIKVPGEPYVNPQVIDTKISENIVQKTVRFYVTRPELDEEGNMLGYSLKKRKILEDGSYSYTDYCSQQFVNLFMNYFEPSDFEEYNINYDFYTSSTWKIINSIEKYRNIKPEQEEKEEEIEDGVITVDELMSKIEEMLNEAV